MKKPLNLLTKAFTALLVLCCGLSISASAQNRAISGTVTDVQNVPIIGASVMVVSNSTTPIGAVTDIDGKFSLNVPQGATLQVSYVGYTTVNVPVGNQTVFTIVLEDDSQFLEETVVIGYGVQKKSDVTGAIASVKDSDLENRTTVVCNSLPSMDRGFDLIAKGKPDILNKDKRQLIYEYILNNQFSGKEARKEHKESVKTYKKNIDDIKDQKMCPYCKTELILRKGKYGAFYGCSNYPKCKYTLKK